MERPPEFLQPSGTRDPSYFPSTFQIAKSRPDSDLENKLGGEVVQAWHLRFLRNHPTVMAHGIVHMDEQSSRPISAPNSPLLIHKVR
jgi:hypothetical protein